MTRSSLLLAGLDGYFINTDDIQYMYNDVRGNNVTHSKIIFWHLHGWLEGNHEFPHSR